MFRHCGIQQFGDEQQPLRMEHGEIHRVRCLKETDVIRSYAETVEEVIDLGDVEGFRTHR